MQDFKYLLLNQFRYFNVFKVSNNLCSFFSSTLIYGTSVIMFVNKQKKVSK